MPVHPIEITALEDTRVDVYRNIRDADLRGRDRLFMAESEMVVRRLLRTPERLHSLLLSREKFAKLESALAALPSGVPVYVTSLSLMHEIAAFHVHRGTLAAGWRLPEDQLSLDASIGPLIGRENILLMVAEGVTNVDNMGALFRNAAAFGVDGLVLDPTCCDPLYRKAIRVSMGHVLSIPYAVSRDWPGDLDRLKQEWAITLVGAELTDDASAVWDMPAARRLGIMFGSEGTGISPDAVSRCCRVCAIPMAKHVPSLNVAVASAVFLYERQRQLMTATRL